MSELVGVGVPAYRGVATIAETLVCLQKQTHRDLDVLISVDGDDGATVAACAPFLSDSRFKLIVQPTRLGWAGNLSWLMARNECPFWYYQQQDDLVDAGYVATLLRHAQENPQAAVTFCDIQCFGEYTSYILQNPVVGSAVSREITLLLDHHPAVALRGLTRKEALRHAAGIRENEVESFSADTVWMASVARVGELHRVPGALYQKRYHRDNVHTKWSAWPVEKRLKGWQVHCRDMFLEASRADMSVVERRLIWAAAVARLVSDRTSSGYVPADALNGPVREEMLFGFLGKFAPRDLDYVEAGLDMPFARISEWCKTILGLH